MTTFIRKKNHTKDIYEYYLLLVIRKLDFMKNVNESPHLDSVQQC